MEFNRETKQRVQRMRKKGDYSIENFEKPTQPSTPSKHNKALEYFFSQNGNIY